MSSARHRRGWSYGTRGVSGGHREGRSGDGEGAAAQAPVPQGGLGSRTPRDAGDRGVSGSGSSKQIAVTTKNAATYLLTGGRRTPLEGRFRGQRFLNWSGVLSHAPDRIERPDSEDEVRRIVSSPTPVRLVGAGHSFNLGFAGTTMVSLDGYRGVDVDSAAGTARVRAGTRMRDVNRK